MDIGIAALSYLDNDKIDADSANRILDVFDVLFAGVESSD